MRTLRVLRIALPCLSIGLLLTAMVFEGWHGSLWRTHVSIIAGSWEPKTAPDATEKHDPFDDVFDAAFDRMIREEAANKERALALSAVRKQMRIAEDVVGGSVLGAAVCGAIWFLLIVPLVWGFLARAYRPSAVGIVKAARASGRHMRGIIDEAKQRESKR